MVVTAPKRSELIEKLIKLANGDRDLVREAIADSVRRTGQADLDTVVKFIQSKIARRAVRTAA